MTGDAFLTDSKGVKVSVALPATLLFKGKAYRLSEGKKKPGLLLTKLMETAVRLDKGDFSVTILG